MDRVPDSLEVLRQEARDELSVLVDLRCRQGEDPWEFIPELPTVDEQVVATLREDRLLGLPPQERRPGEQRFEFGLLRQIALDHPPLTRAVWSLLDRFGATAP